MHLQDTRADESIVWVPNISPTAREDEKERKKGQISGFAQRSNRKTRKTEKARGGAEINYNSKFIIGQE